MFYSEVDPGQRRELNANLGFRFRANIVVIAGNEKQREAEVTLGSGFINAPNTLIILY